MESSSSVSPGSPSPAPTTPSPTAAEPSSSLSATPIAGAFGPVENAGQAIAAVGAFDPQFLGYGPQLPGQIGESPYVTVQKLADGWQLTFVTGSGDCPAGCIDHAFAKFQVTPAGIVTPLCQWTMSAGEVVDGESC